MYPELSQLLGEKDYECPDAVVYPGHLIMPLTVRLSPLTEFDYMNFPKVFSEIEFSKSTKVGNITVFQ